MEFEIDTGRDSPFALVVIKLALQLGKNRVSNSLWASPVVLVQRKDGSLRGGVLNQVTKSDTFPRVDDRPP